jgi:spore coat polysaccharide biosynthesis predicted glycosyltransferase SpsG
MIDAKINIVTPPLRILVAPLDWGLGHATRCISIVYALQELGVTVVLAGDDAVATILKKEFPLCEFLPLKGYHIRYSKRKAFFMFKILSQLGRIRQSIKEEQLWLRKVVTQHKIDGIISDNRLGLYHPQIPSVYITHQLQIKTGTVIGNQIASALHRWYIHRFDACWVPDQQQKPGLAGELSHPGADLKIPVHYLGIISRFRKDPSLPKKGICVLLSGPEPQRTMLENCLLPQLAQLPGPISLVRGLPNNSEPLAVPPNIQCYEHLPAQALNDLLNSTEMVVSRSGYTTIMDLVTLQTQAVLIPTPGQREQEYLANHLQTTGVFYSTEQKGFDLAAALQAAKVFYKEGSMPAVAFNDSPIKEWVARLKRQQ